MNSLFRFCSTAFIIGALVGSARSTTAASLAPVPSGHMQLVAPPDAQRFRFVVTGDNRASSHGAPMPPVFGAICREIGLLRPDFVLWTGDAIEGYEDTAAEANAEYDAFLQTVALCRVPVFNAPGNHELGRNPAMEPIYLRRMGALYGSFDYGNSHFIALDTSPIINGEIHDGEVDEQQMRWLEADLAAQVGKAANIFVFAHHYVFGPSDPDKPERSDTGFKSPALRDRLHTLFVQAKVRAVFCGHAHLYWHANRDSIDYFIAGNAGAPMDATPETGGFPGYLVVNVNGNAITTQVLQPSMTLPRNIRGGDGKATTAEFAIDEYGHSIFAARGIEVVMPAGATYTATKPIEVSILRQTPSPDGRTVTLTLAADLPHGRTTDFIVQPALH